jgi:hypothetical protein
MPYLFTGYHTYCIFKEFSLKLRPRKLRNLQLSSVRTAFLPLFLRARLHFSCIHSFHCLLFVPLSLLCNCGFCCGNLAKQVETVNAPFGELARSESRNLETRCAEAADRRPTLVISISFLWIRVRKVVCWICAGNYKWIWPPKNITRDLMAYPKLWRGGAFDKLPKRNLEVILKSCATQVCSRQETLDIFLWFYLRRALCWTCLRI